MKCPHCSMTMKHLGFSWYQCMLLPRAFNYQMKPDADFDPKGFNPLCLVAQKLS